MDTMNTPNINPNTIKEQRKKIRESNSRNRPTPSYSPKNFRERNNNTEK